MVSVKQIGLDEAIVTNAQRLAQVRRYCQAKPAIAQYSRSSGEATTSRDQGVKPITVDAALTAIIRCLVVELDADIAMVSLLDEDTQYFLCGATKDNVAVAQATLESSKWYGCDTVLHSGGLCEKTICIQPETSASKIYEELNMALDERFTDLPFVNGSLDSFRHYAGTPITTSDGQNIGTVYMMKRSPNMAITSAQTEYMCHVAQQIMVQLELSVQALDCGRLSRLHHAFGWFSHSNHMASNNSQEGSALEHSTDVFQDASDLMFTNFEFDGIIIQEVPLASQPHAPELSLAKRSPGSGPHTVPVQLVSSLLHHHPDGGVFLLPEKSSALFIGPSDDGHGRDCPPHIYNSLQSAIPNAQQVIVCPLWDPLNHRVSAIAIGWRENWDRVYSITHDHTPMLAFGAIIMSEMRRVESMRIEQKKEHFLGLISHELRSPLHGILASIELLKNTRLEVAQQDLVETAANCGDALLSTVDQLLELSHITAKPNEIDSSTLPVPQSRLSKGQRLNCSNLVKICEEVIASTSLVSETHEDNYDPLNGPLSATGLEIPGVSTILFDREPDTDWNFYIQPGSFRRILSNLLSNAKRFTPSGWIRVSLNSKPCQAEQGEQHEPMFDVELVITDTGKGIGKEYLHNRLFEPFTQEDELLPGSGLGLSLVKRLVESLGGTISVNSDENVGTKVTVNIPRLHSAGPHSGYATPTILANDTHQNSKDGDDYHVPDAYFFTPHTENESNSTRRSKDLLIQSMSRILRQVSGCRLHEWPPSEANEPMKLVILSEEDMDQFDPSSAEYVIMLSHSIDHPHHRLGPEKLLQNEVVVKGVVDCTSIRKVLDGWFGAVPTIDLASRPSPATQFDDESLPIILPTHPTLAERDTRSVEAVDEPREVVSNGTIPSPRLSDSPVPMRNPSILNCDDNPVNLKIIGQYVKRCGIDDAKSVPGGQQAIDAFETNHYDIIFMDLSMPGVDGFAATSKIREIERRRREEAPDTKSCQIVALTGLASPEDRKHAFDSGVDDYITKPAKVSQIQKVIEAWIYLQSRN